MEISSKDKLFCEIAIELGYITNDQSEKALDAQKVDDAIEQKKRIGYYLLESNYLTKDKISHIVKMQDRVESSTTKPVDSIQNESNHGQLPPKKSTDSVPFNNKLTKNCIVAIKSTNTPCLWVSLDYWNLYLLEDGAVAVRCYRGKWGIIGFVIGMFLAVVGFLVVGGLGILLDKSNGEGKCRILAGKINEILASRASHTIIETNWDSVSSVETSDLCLGNIWLKYMIKIGNKKFYLNNNQYEQIIDAISILRR